jgi:ribonuclease P protein component
MGIPRAHRLRHRRDIAAANRRGRPYGSGLVVVRALRTDQPLSRFAFTAGRPVGGAVTRNKVKRRLREIARALPTAGGWDLILAARPAAAGARYSQLRSAVSELMAKAGALGSGGGQ